MGGPTERVDVNVLDGRETSTLRLEPAVRSDVPDGRGFSAAPSFIRIPATGKAMTQALETAGHRTGWPMIEVYGHWTSDESKLETETFVELR